jgi:hypothetical protein
MDLNPFEDIAPYNDEEAAAALAKVADHPNVPWISKYIFNNQPETYLRDILKNIHSVDEFQRLVMSRATEWVIEKAVRNFSYDGIAKLQAVKGNYVAMSNHRDIILDPAFTQIILHRNQMPLTEICVGDNLLKSKTIEGLIRSNRMIKVIRGISARELYLSSQVLSKYIREAVTSGHSSVWTCPAAGTDERRRRHYRAGSAEDAGHERHEGFRAELPGTEHRSAEHLLRIRALRRL